MPSKARQPATRPRQSGLRIIIRPDTGALTIDGYVAGQRVRKRAQSSDIRLAREEAATLESDILRTGWHGQRRGSRLFSEALKSYLASAPRTANTKAMLARILRAMGDLPLCEINQQIVNDLRVIMLREDASPATVVRNIITPLRAILGHAEIQGWSSVPRFIIPRQSKGRTKFLLPDEMERLLAVAPPHLRPLLVFLVTTGARMAEAIELDWRDVDLAAPRVNFWKTKIGVPRLNVGLPLRTVLALAGLRHRVGPVFLTARGLPYADRERREGGQINYFWKRLVSAAGLDPTLTPHDLRHTWASWFYVTSDKDLLLLMREGQWTSTRMVERYAHIMPVGQKEAILAFRHELDTGRDQSRASG